MPDIQLDLAPIALGPSETSHEAYASIVEHRNGLSRKVAAAIYECGGRGATREELSEITGLKIQTICARVWELYNVAAILEGPDKRPTRSGRRAFVLRAKCYKPPKEARNVSSIFSRSSRRNGEGMTDSAKAAHEGCPQRCYRWGDFQKGRLWHQECRLKFHAAINEAISDAEDAALEKIAQLHETHSAQFNSGKSQTEILPNVTHMGPDETNKAWAVAIRYLKKAKP